MERYRYREDIEYVQFVLSSLPVKLREKIEGVHFITNYSPIFLGLHFVDIATDGRSLHSTSHHTGEHLQLHLPRSRRRSTVSLLDGDSKDRLTILHELGHALHERLEHDYFDIIPLGEYAKRNRFEAFATSFQSWLTPYMEEDVYGYYTKDRLLETDPKTYWLFENLFK